jgi:hypothetical protein
MEAGSGNEFELDYGCGPLTIVGYRIIALILGLLVFLPIYIYINNKGWSNIELGDIIIIFIAIIIGSTLYLQAGQLLGSSCGAI